MTLIWVESENSEYPELFIECISSLHVEKLSIGKKRDFWEFPLTLNSY